MGMHITITIAESAGEGLDDQIRRLVQQRTGKDPVINIIRPSVKFDNLSGGSYNRMTWNKDRRSK